MAGNQLDNLMLLDLTTGLPRTNETGGTPDTIQLSVDFQLISGANMLVDGDLVVNGTTTTLHSEQVNLRDNHLYLNADYTTVAAQTGGLVINVLPTATTDTVAAAGFTAGVAAVSNPTVITTGAATFAVGDIIQIAGANNQANDGIFEVLTHVGTTLTIRGVGVSGTTVSWVTNQFTTDATVGGDIRIVTVNVLEGDSSGNWSTATVTNTTGITYNTFTTQGTVDLQEAYEAGNTITTSVGEGNVIITGTETLAITTTGGVNLDSPFDFDSTVFDVQMTGSNGFSIDGTAASNVTVTAGNLTLSTVTSGALVGSSAAGVDLDATTTFTINTANATNASGNDITITAGNSLGGTNAGASIILAPGDGNLAGVAGLVDITGPQDEDEPMLQFSGTGTNAETVQLFAGSSSPDTLVSAPAGSLFMRDTGTGAELYLNTSAGSGTSWTELSTAAGATLQSAYVAGNTITTSGAEGNVTINGTEDLVVGGSVDVDFNTTGAISLDADLASNFTVDGNALVVSTTTSGNLDVSAAEDLALDGATSASLNSSGGTISIGNDAVAQAINIGTGAAARTITMGNATGATTLNFDSGTGGYTFDSTVAQTVALMTLTTTGASGDSVNLFVGDSNPNGTVTGLAGSLFLRDTGAGGALYVNESVASGTTWNQVVTSGAGGSLTLQNAYVGGNTIVTSAGEGNLDVSGTEGISLDAGGSSNFTVDSNDLTLSTTSSGTLYLDAVVDLQVNFGTNVSAGVVFGDGVDNFITLDSTTGDKAVEINRFLDVTGMGAGVTLTAGVAIAVGDVVALNSAGDVILADSNTGTDTDAYVIGVALTAALVAAPVRIFTMSGDLVPVAFTAAPGAATNGSMVFLSATGGRATLTAPTGSSNVIYKIGILQGADGADTTPLVIYQPQFLAKRP